MTDLQHSPTTYTVHPQALAKKNDERSYRDCQSAQDVLALAVEATKGNNPTAEALAAYAEVLWQWKTTDTWPPRQQP